MSWGAMIPAIAGVASSVYSNIMNKKAQQKQVQDQMKLNRQQHESQMDMWKATNYKEQILQMKKAGLSPGLIYGQSGGSGATTGSLGAGSASKADVTPIDLKGGAEIAMMESQKKLLDAQTEKTKAEAEKTAGVDTEATKTQTEQNKFDLQIKNEIGAGYYARQARIEMEGMNVENAQKIREFEAWMEEAFDQDAKYLKHDVYGTYSTGNNLINKVKEAGLKHTVEELTRLKAEYENTQSQTAINKMETEIRQFKVDLSKYGLNESTASIIHAIIQGLFGMKIKSQTGKTSTTINK